MAVSKKAESAEKKSKKLSGPEQVAEFMNTLEHPLKAEIAEVRSIILQANEQLSEHIKWKAPSFCCDHEDRITFNLHGKGYFTLVFHRGAKVKDTIEHGPLIEDATGLMTWAANDRATIRFTDMDDVQAKKEPLTVLVNQWIDAARS